MVTLQAGTKAVAKQERLFYLDWLRVLAVLGVFFYHTLRPFVFSDWNVKNTEQSLVVTIFLGFFYFWGMCLFFVVSGAGSWFAVRSRTGRQFLRERSLRLLVPLLVGFLLLSPPQAYIEALTHGHFQGSFFQFVPWFFEHMQISWHAPWIGYSYHLWFLEFLWLYALIALPLFLFLRGAAGSRVIDKLAGWCARPGGIFLFIAPIALIQMALRAAFPGEHDWADFVYYFAFFIFGSLLFSRPSFAEAIRRHGWIALGIGIVCTFIMGMAFATSYDLFMTWESSPSSTAGALLYQLLRSINTWAWIVFVLSCGIRWLNFNKKILPEANEALLPLYVLQQPAIILIAFYVVQWNMAILPKWLIITTLALALTLAVYELLIRRVNAMRWLFGMKPRQRTPHTLPASSSAPSPFHGEGRGEAEVMAGKADQPVLLHTKGENHDD